MKSKTIASLTVAAALLAGMTGTANAVTVTTTGAKTTTSTLAGASYYWDVTSYDTSKSDGRFVSAPWRASNGVGGSVVNKKGSGSVTEGIVGNKSVRLSKVRACRSSGGILPMSCSNWAQTGY